MSQACFLAQIPLNWATILALKDSKMAEKGIVEVLWIQSILICRVIEEAISQK